MKFDKLEEKLRERRADYYKNLNKGLSIVEVEDFGNKYGIELPNDLKSLYMWRNGQVLECYEPFIDNFTLMDLEESLETWKMLTDMIGYDFEIDNWWNEAWIPILSNGGGSYICYDISGIFTGHKGQIIEFWKSDDDRNVIAPSLESFIENIVDYYNEVDEIGEYIEVKDIEGYPLEFIVD